MSKSIKWILAALLALSVVIVARASLLSNNYLPIVRNSYPVMPTLTPTVTPTPTNTPTPTKTPDTPCLSLKDEGVCITKIDYDPTSGGPLNEFIRLKNVSSSSEDMKDWRISSDSGNKYDMNFAFSLSGNADVTIWTKSGDNDSNDLYMDREEEFWNNKEDCAYVIDEDRKKVDSICYRADEDLGVIFFAPPVTAP